MLRRGAKTRSSKRAWSIGSRNSSLRTSILTASSQARHSKIPDSKAVKSWISFFEAGDCSKRYGPFFDNQTKMQTRNVDLSSHLLFGNASQGHLDESVGSYSKALKLNGKDPEVYSEIARVLIKMGQNSLAEKHLQTAVGLLSIHFFSPSSPSLSLPSILTCSE